MNQKSFAKLYKAETQHSVITWNSESCLLSILARECCWGSAISSPVTFMMNF